MESKNLNDIVIEDNDNSKKAQLKNILTLLALLFIILVISIVITKLILGNDEESNETNPAVSSTIVNGTNSSISGATAGVIGTTAALGTAAILANRASDKSSLVDSETSVSKKVPLRDHRPTPKKVVRHTTTHRSTYVRTRHTPRPTPKPTPKPTVTKKYYIKVGAFKDPSNAIKAIKAHHLEYKTIDIKDGELTRVLVGPYSTQTEAQKDLDEVKAKISSSAYITRIK